MNVESEAEAMTSDGAGTARACPFCSASIPQEVSLCAACGRFSRPIIAAKPVEPKQPIIERANTAIAKWEADPQIQQRLKWIQTPINFSVPRWLRLGLGAILLLLSGAMSSLWLRYGGWGPARDAFALLATGASLLLGSRVLRANGRRVVEPTERPPNDASIRVLGYDLNIGLAQGLALAGMILFGLRSEVDTAWNCALAVVLLTPFLWRTRYQRFAILAGGAGFLYAAYIWSVGDLAYRINATIDARETAGLFSPVAPFLWVILLVALVPHLQLPRIDKVGVGGFRGDTSFTLFGSDVPIVAGSSLILVSAALAVEPFLFVPWWIRTAILGL